MTGFDENSQRKNAREWGNSHPWVPRDVFISAPATSGLHSSCRRICSVPTCSTGSTSARCIPPLRERREDVPLLAAHFLRRFAPQKAITLTHEAEQALCHYDWPGNVRELRNVIQRLALFAVDEIRPADLPPEIAGNGHVERLVRACGRCMVDGGMS